MKYHPLVKEIRNLLESKKYWFATFEHPPVRTSEEAATVRGGFSLKQGAKAIVIRVKSGGEKFFVMLVIPGDSRFDNNKVKKVLNAKDIRFASEVEVNNITDGVVPGGVPPFGNLFGLKVLVDKRLFQNEKIIFNAGDRRFSIAMKSYDYIKIVGPEVVDIV